MTVFTDAELEYLAGQPLGRIATASPTGEPEVSPVGFTVEADAIVTTGFDITKTIRYRNIQRTGRASMVIDDLETVDPWVPRGVKVRGNAEIVTDAQGRSSIRITPDTVWSWGINEGVETHFAGRIEKRSVAAPDGR
jgi:pyridoxamine 5'-phosphate oxidase family protein